MVKKYGAIFLEALIAVVIVAFFAGFGDTSTITGAFHQDIDILRQTIRGQGLRANFSGLNWTVLYVSFRLIVLATLLSALFGTAHALLSVQMSRRAWRATNEWISTLFQSLPEAMYVILVFVALVFLLSHGINLPGLFHDGIPRIRDTFAPAIALAMPGGLYLRRILANRLKDEWLAPYVDTARAKGLSDRAIFYRHIVPNVLPLAFRQIPVVAGFVISSAVFAEYFLGYMGALFRFISFVGWNMNSGALSLQKPMGIPTYQAGAVFIVGLLLVFAWLIFRLLGEWLSNRVPRDVEPAPTPSRHRIDVVWLVAGVLCIGIVLFFATFPHLLTSANPFTKKLIDTKTYTFPPYPPSHVYLLGTDAAGRDLLARTLHGTFQTLFQVALTTVVVLVGSLLIATIALLNEAGWFSRFVLRFGRILSAMPVLLIVFLAVYHRNLASPYQEWQFIGWIALFEIGRGCVTFYGAMVEWYAFGFVEGAISVGQTRLGILFKPLRSWLGQFALEYVFSELTRVLSLMTLLAMLHTYAVEGIVYLSTTPPTPAIGSLQLTWFSLLGDAANQVFSIISHPFIIYAPVLALLLTMFGASFIARGLRGSR